MKFKVVYESLHKREYYDVVLLLENAGVAFQKLHEYRLNPATNYASIGSGGGNAEIRVSEDDFLKVEKLLTQEGFIRSDSFVPIKRDVLQEYSSLDRAFLDSTTGSIIGSSIVDVYYILSPDIEFDFESIHSVDAGIVFQISNGDFLFWRFREKDFDFEIGFYMPDAYHLSIEREFPKINSFFRVEKLSENQAWQPFINQRIEDIRVYTQFFEKQEVDKQKVVTDLIIETTNATIAIYSAEKPVEDEEQINVVLAINNEWTIVVFDEELIASSDRVSP